MTILLKFYDILHTYTNVLIHETSYNNFTTDILRSLFRYLMTFQIIQFQHHPTRKNFFVSIYNTSNSIIYTKLYSSSNDSKEKKQTTTSKKRKL